MHKAEDEADIVLDTLAGANDRIERFNSTARLAEAFRLLGQFPHCDPRVLHAPGQCEFCDKHPKWQAMRLVCGIAYTGYVPDGTELPDPATHARGDSLKRWHGNRASR